MKYQEAQEFIDQSIAYGSVPGLETITELLGRLGNPQEQLKIIHVTGTNGKGSTSSFTESILTAAGYSVGRYLSPAVFTYWERIQIRRKGSAAAANITEQGICDTLAKIKPVCESMVREGFAHPTSFEIETAMAMLYLLWEQVDFAIVEVGLGGSLDATNVIKHPVCCIITSISMDHMQYLGSTLEQIARHKAGIIKSGVPVVTCRQEQEVMQVLQKTCAQKNAPLYLAETDKLSDIRYSPEETAFSLWYEGQKQEYTIKLLGEHQIENGVLAMQAARAMNASGYPVREEAVRKGLSETRWRGRFELIARQPYIIIDGAHNADAARRLRKSIEIYFSDRRIVYIIGVLADKDYQSILKITAPLADLIITLTPDNIRALPAAVLAREAEACGKRAMEAGCAAQAMELALKEAGKEDVIIAFGSLSYLGELVTALETSHI